MDKITILGGGIAGVEAAIFCRKYGLDVELISERDYVYIYPIAIWIPISTLPSQKARIPLSQIAKRHNFSLTIARITQINGSENSIFLDTGEIRQEKNLIIAIGSGKMKHPGIEHTLSICGKPEEAELLKEKIDALIAKGSGKIAFGFGGNPKDASAVRGGPGFELFFNLHHRLKQLGIRDRFEMHFFAPMPKPGARMGEQALSMMKMMFEKNRFHSHYGKKISRFEYNKVIFEDESTLENDLLMFIPAGNAHQVILDSDLPKNEAGFIRITSDCRIEGMKNWYAIGDAAALEGPEWKAKQGHIAEVMGRCAAANLSSSLFEDSVKNLTYTDHISILCMMDMGNGAGLVFRNDKGSFLLPMPIFGHWIKRLWGHYYRLSKLKRFPRLPGL